MSASRKCQRCNKLTLDPSGFCHLHKNGQGGEGTKAHSSLTAPPRKASATPPASNTGASNKQSGLDFEEVNAEEIKSGDGFLTYRDGNEFLVVAKDVANDGDEVTISTETTRETMDSWETVEKVPVEKMGPRTYFAKDNATGTIYGSDDWGSFKATDNGNQEYDISYMTSDSSSDSAIPRERAQQIIDYANIDTSIDYGFDVGDTVALKADHKDPDTHKEYAAGTRFNVADISSVNDREGNTWVYTRGDGPVLDPYEVEPVGITQREHRERRDRLEAEGHDIEEMYDDPTALSGYDQAVADNAIPDWRRLSNGTTAPVSYTSDNKEIEPGMKVLNWDMREDETDSISFVEDGMIQGVPTGEKVVWWRTKSGGLYDGSRLKSL